MGGKIWIQENDENFPKGSRFCFEVPMEGSDATHRHPAHKVCDVGPLSGKKVIFCKNSGKFREMIRDAMARWGIETTCVDGVHDIQHILTSNAMSIDAIIIDCHIMTLTPSQPRKTRSLVDIADVHAQSMRRHLPRSTSFEGIFNIDERAFQRLSQSRNCPLLALISPEFRKDVTVVKNSEGILTTPFKICQLYDALVKLIADPISQNAAISVTTSNPDIRLVPMGSPILTRSNSLTTTRIVDENSNFGEKYLMRILIAEDNVVNQRIISKMLFKLGYSQFNLKICENGKIALDAIQESIGAMSPFDVILMDIFMPEMDGLEATEKIISLTSPAHVRTYRPYIIALTANAMRGDEAACRNAGMSDYLTKPVTITVLMSALETAFSWKVNCSLNEQANVTSDVDK
eukprot:TRINITY_DN8378_c0_g1_i1.p1 TRINITY_DN8378_c0_g1~~TRINITY_DN8378_c0_g1_i1.p1  ORF type:complete len:416 (+),score=112.63 TRINITY_DN8378_c0_g1_i1:38-1249(+)